MKCDLLQSEQHSLRWDDVDLFLLRWWILQVIQLSFRLLSTGAGWWNSDGGWISNWRKAYFRCFPHLHMIMIHSWNHLFFLHSSVFLCVLRSFVTYRAGVLIDFCFVFVFKENWFCIIFCFVLSLLSILYVEIVMKCKSVVSFTDLFVCVSLSVRVCVLGYWPGSSQVHCSVQLLCGSCFRPRGCRGEQGSGQTPQG